MYTTLARSEDRIMIPNNGVPSAVVVPVRLMQAILDAAGSPTRSSRRSARSPENTRSSTTEAAPGVGVPSGDHDTSITQSV